MLASQEDGYFDERMARLEGVAAELDHAARALGEALSQVSTRAHAHAPARSEMHTDTDTETQRGRERERANYFKLLSALYRIVVPGETIPK